ncbi:hypothetical protein DCS_05858 [Drechmeria coniospora]|uniref:Uncharacterized protein n=1 Tax=Drechmeria coniospora TaxID=98403 RepID=A0A151GP31_DRECN|nr:hypothetical protein DCS_05858 [Drechmeria coniospora]KYK58840.1 hypothetical protein DCS_05858 [Drechmeria coniospora]
MKFTSAITFATVASAGVVKNASPLSPLVDAVDKLDDSVRIFAKNPPKVFTPFFNNALGEGFDPVFGALRQAGDDFKDSSAQLSKQEAEALLELFKNVEKEGKPVLTAFTDTRDAIIKAGACAYARLYLSMIDNEFQSVTKTVTARVSADYQHNIQEHAGQFSGLLRKSADLFPVDQCGKMKSYLPEME